jgi:hypothetical protein
MAHDFKIMGHLRSDIFFLNTCVEVLKNELFLLFSFVLEYTKYAHIRLYLMYITVYTLIIRINSLHNSQKQTQFDSQ